MKPKASVVAILSLIFFVSCASTNSQKDQAAPSRSWGQRESTACAIFEIVDQKMAEKLRDSKDSTDFWDRVNSYGSRGLTWPKLLANYSYCDTTLATPLDPSSGIKDARWNYYLRLGPPTGEWKIPGEERTRKGSRNFNYWEYQWESGEIILLRGDAFPTEVAPQNRTLSWDWSPMYIEASVAALPKNPDGTFEIIASVAIPLVDVNAKTFKKGKLRIVAALNNESGLVAKLEEVIRLDAYRLIALASSNQEEHFIPLSHKFSEIPVGRYRFKIEIFGADGNRGEKELLFDVPSSKTWGMGDLIFLRPNPPQGSLAPQRIERSGKIIEPWAVNIFPRGVSLRAVAEIASPPESCFVSVSFFPRPNKSAREKSDAVEVRTGEISGVDSVKGEEYFSKWAWPRTSVELLRPDTGNFPPLSSIEIFSGVFIGGKGWIEIPVNFTAPAGRYWLKTTITNPKKDKYFGVAVVEVEIREPM